MDGSKASLAEWRKIDQLSGALPCKGRQVFSKRKSSRPKVSRKVALEKPCQGGNFARIVATFVCLKITRERDIFLKYRIVLLFFSFFFVCRLEEKKKKKLWDRQAWQLAISIAWLCDTSLFRVARKLWREFFPLGKMENFNSKRWKRIRTIWMHNRDILTSLLGFHWLVTLQKVGVYYAYEIGES